jgi:hypothetical protein
MSFNNHANFWNELLKTDKNDFEEFCKFILEEFGTYLACNRFDIGNSIEYATADMIIKKSGFHVEKLPNAIRYDLNVCDYGLLSVKYSSSGNIKLHNSLGSNKDMTVKNTLIITPKKLYLIIIELINDMEINIKDYLKDCGDSLELKRAFLTILEKNKYPYICNIDIEVNKKTCKNRSCSEVFYKYVKYKLARRKRMIVNFSKLTI